MCRLGGSEPPPRVYVRDLLLDDARCDSFAPALGAGLAGWAPKNFSQKLFPKTFPKNLFPKLFLKTFFPNFSPQALQGARVTGGERPVGPDLAQRSPKGGEEFLFALINGTD